MSPWHWGCLQQGSAILRAPCCQAAQFAELRWHHLRLNLHLPAGFLGQNGSGKSSLLRILAGEDTSFQGERFLTEGINVAYLEQEPRLDSGRTVDDNIRPALARMQAVLDEYNQVQTCNMKAAALAHMDFQGACLAMWRSSQS